MVSSGESGVANRRDADEPLRVRFDVTNMLAQDPERVHEYIPGVIGNILLKIEKPWNKLYRSA